MSKPDRSSPEYKQAIASCLKWDEERNKPYLQLPSFPDLRLIPYHEGLADDIKTLFNHHVIGKRLFVLPYPMSQEFALDFEKKNITQYTPILAQIADTIDRTTLKPKPNSPPILGFPFKCLYSVSQQRMVGDMNLHLNGEDPVSHKESQEMKDRKVEDQSWITGYVIEPSLHGQGIMSEIMGCMLEGWVKPWLRCGEVSAWIQFDNPGSMAVAKKHGFKLVHDEWTQWPEQKGGGKRHAGYYVLKL